MLASSCWYWLRSVVVLVVVALSGAQTQPPFHALGPVTSSIPLVQALVDADSLQARRLVEGGADVNANDAIPPLYAAQEYLRRSHGRHAMLRTLLRAGARVDEPTDNGTTALMLAAYQVGLAAPLRQLLPSLISPPLTSSPSITFFHRLSPSPAFSHLLPHLPRVTCAARSCCWTMAPTRSE